VDPTLAQIAAGNAIIFVGAVVQAASGLASGLLIAPFLLMIHPDFVPGPLIASSVFMTGVMSFRERAHFRIGSLNPVLVGSVVGSALAIAVMARLDVGETGLLFGCLLLLCVGISVAGLDLPVNRTTMFLTGIASAFVGTIAAVGGIILALLWQRASGPAVRGTLSYLYFMVSLLMLGFLAYAGRFSGVQAMIGLSLVPAWIVAYACSRRLAAFLDRGYTRIAILGLATISGVVLIARNV
jgi:uncharacterized membrane protein YfcA